MDIPGVLDALVVDHATGTAVAVAGSGQHLDAERSAAALNEALRATLDGLAEAMTTGTLRMHDMIVTTDRGHHLLKPVTTVLDGEMVIYLRIDVERSNLALARHRLQAISARLTT
ncbi:roadblock/LC7 domain-containing protein [Thermocatellispora tengchongensis]